MNNITSLISVSIFASQNLSIEEHLSHVYHSLISLDSNLNKVLKHLRDKDDDDDILAPKKKPRYNIYMNSSYSTDGSKQGTSSSHIKIEDTNNKNPPQVYHLKPKGIYHIVQLNHHHLWCLQVYIRSS